MENNINLSEVNTRDLVNELKKREGVQALIAEPYAPVKVDIEGPAIVLVVTD